MAMEPLSFLWLSSQPRRGQVTMYSFRLICTLTSHAVHFPLPAPTLPLEF